MSNIIQLNKIRKSRQQDKAKWLTLCQSGFHKWKVIIDNHFDVHQGKLVTTERCLHCATERTLLK